MVMKLCSILLRVSEVETRYQIQFNVILRTPPYFRGVLPLHRGYK